MKGRWILMGMLLMVAVGTGALFGCAGVTEDDGFVALFDGKTLNGWIGDERLWSVEDGVILGSTEGVTIQRNTFLSTEKIYKDFVLKAKVKLRNHNSGIQFRSERKDDFVVVGYQADVATKTYFGMLYEEGKRGIMEYWKALSKEEQAAIHGASKAGEWNAYEIRCQGDHITMTLNGEPVLDLMDPDGAKEGVVALQLHQGEPMEVRFKEISIKEL